MRINVKNGRKWVRALRSGEYVQGTAQLRTGGPDAFKHCCLGVATDLYDPELCNQSACHGVMPGEVADWLGLTDLDPYLYVGEAEAPRGRGLTRTTEEQHASVLNDSWDFTFEQIADAIERTWPEVKLQKNRTKAERELVDQLDRLGEINWGKKA